MKAEFTQRMPNTPVIAGYVNCGNRFASLRWPPFCLVRRCLAGNGGQHYGYRDRSGWNQPAERQGDDYE
jgi:hypothetical protein